MPNWSYNTLTIEGPSEDIDRLLAAIEATRNNEEERFRGGYSLLRTFIPRPEAVVENGTWYDWSVTHWGTKWEDAMRVDEREDNRLTMRGETAWAPPIPGYTTVSAMFPTLTFIIDYDEEGGWFVGATRMVNGESFTVDVNAEDEGFPQPDESIDDEEQQWEDYRERLNDVRLQCRDEVTP